MPPVYIISYQNKDRRNRMTERFTKLGMTDVSFTQEVDQTDPRLASHSIENRRNASIMLQHLDSMRLFLSTTHEHCIVCEDDIHISTTLTEKLPSLVHDFVNMKLDVMMLGYILTFCIDMNTGFHQGYFPYVSGESENKITAHSYHSYPDDIWGSQMYMVSRSYASYLLANYDVSPSTKINYNPDWIITKNGKRALIYPMLALEERSDRQNYDYGKQYSAHYNETFL